LIFLFLFILSAFYGATSEDLADLMP
jgi:hypothetical protein